MIGIVDYGLGNINAINNIYHSLNIPSMLISNKEELCKAERLIIPGVGAFDWAMECLNNSGMKEELNECIIRKKIPVLGICIGMQIMCCSSEEGKAKGLCWVDAKVKKLGLSNSNKIQIPHMGWNSITVDKSQTLFKSVNTSIGFYFLHSYYVDCGKTSIEIAYAHHGVNFTASFCYNNIFAVQFHPEKSHDNGVQLFKNFAEVNIS